MYFHYTEEATDYLKKKDRILGRVIDQIGPVEREVIPDLFSAVVHAILGQQISTKAHHTIWCRLQAELGEVNAQTILAAGRDRLQQLGTTYRKVDHILDFSRKVQTGEVELRRLSELPDQAFIDTLSQLKGVGVWTAEMILLFCLQRPDVFSYGDLAILRGIRMVYHHREISRARFETYRRRFSPYCSVASLYFWAVAGGAIPGLKDYAPAKRETPSGRQRGLGRHAGEVKPEAHPDPAPPCAAGVQPVPAQRSNE